MNIEHRKIDNQKAIESFGESVAIDPNHTSEVSD